MLDAIKDNEATRFSLMKQTGINSLQLKKYLGSLIEMGFIETYMREGRIAYKTTLKGIAFLRQYYVLLEMLLGGPPLNNPIIVYGASNGQ